MNFRQKCVKFLTLRPTLAMLVVLHTLRTRPTSWLPPLLFASITIASITLWLSLMPLEQQRVRLEAEKVTALMSSSVAGKLRGQFAVMQRHIERLDGSTNRDNDFRSNGQRFLRDFPALLALHYRGSDEQVHRLVRPGTAPDPLFAALPASADGWSATEVTGYARWVSPPTLLADGTLVYFLVFAKADTGNGHSELIAAYDARRWVGTAFDSTSNYSIKLIDGAIVVHANEVAAADSKWSAHESVSMLGRPWQVVVTPTHTTVDAMTTRLPALILVGGELFGIVMALALHLILLGREHADGLVRAKLDLLRQTEVRRSAESSRDLAQQELGSLLESITDGFMLVDHEWRFIYANDFALAPTRQTRETLLGRTLWEIAPSLAGSAEAEKLRRAMTERITVAYERRSEDQRIYSVRVYPHQGGLAIYFHDVTAQHETADRIRENETLLKQAQLIAHIGSFNLNLATGSENWSDELFHLFGLAPGSHRPGQQLLLSHTLADDHAKVAATFAAALANQPFDTQVKFCIHRGDGEIRTLCMRMLSERDQQDQLQRVVGTVQDISEHEHAAAKLQTALSRSRRQSSQFRALNRAMLLVSAKLGDGDLPQILVEELRTTVQAHFAILHLLAADGSPSQSHFSLSEKYTQERGFSASVHGFALLSAAARGGRVVRLTSAEVLADPDWSAFSDGDAHAPLRGLLSVPMHARDGSLVGFLQASDHYGDEFSADDEAIAIQFAQIAVIAIETKQLIDDLRDTQTDLSRRIDDANRSHTLLAEAEHIASLGSWEWLVNEATPRVMLSDGAAKILGMGNQRVLLPAALATLLHAEDSARALDLCGQIFGTQALSLDGEFRLLQGDAARWIHVRARVERDANELPTRVIGSVQDISQQRARELQKRLRGDALASIATGSPLLESLQKIVAMHENTDPDGLCSILLAHADGGLHTAIAPRLPAGYSERIDGVQPGPAVGSCGTAAFNRQRVIVSDIDTDARWLAYRDTAREFGLRACWSNPIIDIDGTLLGTFAVYYRDVREPTQKELDSLDKATAIAAIALEAQRSRHRLEDREQRFRSLFAYVPEAVFELALDGTVLNCNSAALQMSGYRHAELVGHALVETVALEDRARMLEHLQRAAAGETQMVELRRQRPDGSIYVSESTELPIIVDNQRVGVFAIVRDVTTERAAQLSLETALDALKAHNRELEEFAFVASHDLQEPLRKVRAFGDRLRTHLSATEDDAVRDYITRMSAAAERMQRLIDDLLAYSRVGKRVERWDSIDLNAILQGVLGDLETHIEQKQAQVTAELLPTIDGDATWLRQVMQNLISNALKFSIAERAPQIRIDSEIFRRGSHRDSPIWIRLRISDNGIGFEDRHAERIFAPFQRLHGQSEYAGSGIGLAIVRRIVERHGGRISAKGQTGNGAVFTVELPQSLAGRTISASQA